jgi:hypothetical protein
MAMAAGAFAVAETGFTGTGLVVLWDGEVAFIAVTRIVDGCCAPAGVAAADASCFAALSGAAGRTFPACSKIIKHAARTAALAPAPIKNWTERKLGLKALREKGMGILLGNFFPDAANHGLESDY